MKKIIYSFILILVIVMSAVSFINKKENKYTTVLLGLKNGITSKELLEQSAQIINNRLKSYSSYNYEITVLSETNKIKVNLADCWDINKVEKLITQKGRLEFYKAYSFKDFMELIKGDTTLFSMLNDNSQYELSSKLGCISLSELNKVNAILNSLPLDKTCKFAWDGLFDNSNICLYALKIENDNGSLLKSGVIESVTFKPDSKSNHDYLELKFKKSVIGLWSQITKQNINNFIAIVLDDNVLFCPILRNGITNGNCLITGNFDREQLKFIAAVGENGELPIELVIVK